MSKQLFEYKGIVLTQISGPRKTIDESAPQFLEVYTTGDMPKRIEHDAARKMRDALNEYLGEEKEHETSESLSRV